MVQKKITNSPPPKMSYKKDGIEFCPLFCTQVNNTYSIGVYKGSISEFDILIKYRQMESGKWSRLRTPKHIHWAVDLLIKMHGNQDLTKDFLRELINIWKLTCGLKSEKERKEKLSTDSLLSGYEKNFKKYEELGQNGEYSIKFLILVAKLLMLQEKTNREDAYMFKNLLVALKEGKSIYKIISTATFRGK